MTGFSVVQVEDAPQYHMTRSTLHVGQATVQCSTHGNRVNGPEVCLTISSGPWIRDAYEVLTRDSAHITITPEAARAFAAHLCELADKAERQL